MMREFWKTYIYNPDLANPYVQPRDTWKDWYIYYDVYNASDFQFPLSLKFFASSSNGGRWANAGASANMVPGEWVQVKISVDEIAASTTSIALGQMKKAFH